MAQSRLTVRTLGLAMVALVLACVHAARGDGRAPGVATFTSGTRGASAVATRAGSGVVTLKGDPWKAPADKSAAGAQTAAARAARQTAERSRLARTQARDEPICIVRRVSPTELQRDWTDRARQIAATEPVLAPALRLPDPSPPLKRNAFALGPTITQGSPESLISRLLKAVPSPAASLPAAGSTR